MIYRTGALMYNSIRFGRDEHIDGYHYRFITNTLHTV